MSEEKDKAREVRYSIGLSDDARLELERLAAAYGFPPSTVLRFLVTNLLLRSIQGASREHPFSTSDDFETRMLETRVASREHPGSIQGASIQHGTGLALKSEYVNTRDQEGSAEGGTPVATSDDLFAHPLAEVFEGLDWFGAKLPASVTVSQFLHQAEKEYPDVELDTEMVRASGWLMANPDKRKTRLAPFLLGWLKRAKNPPAWQKEKPPKPRRVRSCEEALWDGVHMPGRDENGMDPE